MARVTAPPEVHTAAATGAAAAMPAPDDPAPPGRSERLRSRLAAVPRRAWVALVVVVLVAAAALTYALTRPPGIPPITQRDVDASVQKGIEKRAEAEAAAPADATRAYAAIAPSLVLITTEGGAAGADRQGTGAGVVVNADGTVLTALHVVEGAGTITLSFADGTVSAAKIATSQPQNDIATLTPKQLPETVVPAILGGGVAVGAPVFAVGHPLGLTNSLSAGVVSALDRTVQVEGKKPLHHLIQIDAAVNPGNSGGPLLNRDGQVIGIVAGLVNPTEQDVFIGLGFAVPITVAGTAAGLPPY